MMPESFPKALTSLGSFAFPIAKDQYGDRQDNPRMNTSAQAALAVRLAGLWIYHIKSCAGVAVENAELNEQGGLKGDREWAVINAGGELVWQGGIPKMALVRPVPQSDGLLLHAPGVSPLRVNLSDRAKPCEVRIWNEGLRAFETFAGHCSGRTVWFMASVFAGLMNVRSRDPRNNRSGFVLDLPLQLANQLSGFSPQRRKMAEREGFEPISAGEAKSLKWRGLS